MDCLEFRRRVGAEPSADDAGLAAHRDACAPCARYQDELREMDGWIARALAIDPAALRRPARAAAGAVPPDRIRRFAIAASVAVAVGVGMALFVGAPRASVAREVVEHVSHEPGTTAATAPLAPAALAAVLGPDGMRLKPDIGDVTFAARCLFDGRVVPHLVVRTADGPVTVLVLRHRRIDEPVRLDEQGFEGIVLPAPRGAIAVVGHGVADVEATARRVFDAVDWGG